VFFCAFCVSVKVKLTLPLLCVCIAWKGHLRNDLYCVGWDIKPYSFIHSPGSCDECSTHRWQPPAFGSKKLAASSTDLFAVMRLQFLSPPSERSELRRLCIRQILCRSKVQVPSVFVTCYKVLIGLIIC